MVATPNPEPEDDLDPGTLERRIERHLDRRCDSLAWYHTLGALLARVQEAATYGNRWQRRFTARSGVSRDVVYQAIKFALLFTPEEVREWEGRIAWNKFRLVLSVDGHSRRLGLLRLAVEEGLSDRALSAAVGERGTSHLPRGGPGRKDPRSKGWTRDVAEYSRCVQRLLDHHAVVFARAGGTLAELRERLDDIGPRLRLTLEQLREDAAVASLDLADTEVELRELLDLLPEEDPEEYGDID